MKLNIGDSAPIFDLIDQHGALFTLASFIGKQYILIYFYPKDETPGCIKEACTFRDNIEQFEGLNCMVVGISRGSESSHQKFAQHYNLPFTILSDKKNKVRKLYGVKDAIPGILAGRKTFLIDKKGNISAIIEHQFKPKLHIQEALEALEND